jgi:hypothetical protein
MFGFLFHFYSLSVLIVYLKLLLNRQHHHKHTTFPFPVKLYLVQYHAEVKPAWLTNQFLYRDYFASQTWLRLSWNDGPSFR